MKGATNNQSREEGISRDSFIWKHFDRLALFSTSVALSAQPYTD